MAVIGWVVSVAVAFIALISPLISQVTELSKLRQAWINDQRSDIAEFVGLAEEWQRAREDSEASSPKDLLLAAAERDARRKALVVLFRVKMRINPLPDSPTRSDDDFLMTTLHNLLDPQVYDAQGWLQSAEEAVGEAQEMLKREWDVVKTPAYEAMYRAAFGKKRRA